MSIPKSAREKSSREKNGETVETFLSNYILNDVIKTEEYYSIREAVSKLDSEQYLIKTVFKEKITNEKKMKKIRKEMEIMKSINHPHIIKLYDYFENDDCIVSISEFVPVNADLFDKIVAKGSFSEQDAIRIIDKILDALSYLHGQNIVHRDLKPENIVYYNKGNEEIIKIAGFEISTIQNEESKLFTSIGTPCYIAPEVILCDGYDKEVDMWGVGIVAYMLIAGFPPFYVDDDNEAKLIETVVSLGYTFEDQVWDETSESAKDFIKKLLVKEPSERLTVEAARLHPWIKSN